MKDYSCFDILGPIMVGPSSSHTAGACRLGRIAAVIAGGDIRKVTFCLYGSFAATYRGHGTDRALLAGILGMNPDDERLPDSFKIADEQGILYQYETGNADDSAHPNTVKIVMEEQTGEVTAVVGASIGGGSVVISRIDGLSVDFTGEYYTIITRHRDKPGVVAKVSSKLASYGVNIAYMKVFRESKGDVACMVIESDQPILDEVRQAIDDISEIDQAVILQPV